VVRLPEGMLADTVERRRQEIEAIFERFFGRPTRLSLKAGPAASAADPPAPTVPSIAQVEAAERVARSARLQQTARGHPNIQDAARILDGGVQKIEEL